MTSVDDFLANLGGPHLISWHHHNGTHRSAVDYLQLHRDLLVGGLGSSRLLYLDTNFWVRLRDAAMGRGTPEAVKLLQTLRTMVRSREALCVSQIHSFLEVGKQSETSLRVSAELLDELTEGVAIASPDDLMQWECAEFIKATLNRNVGQELCPWTKVGQIHKNELPTEMLGPISPAQKEVVMKAVIDSLWNASFDYVFAQFNWNTKSKLNADLDAEMFEVVAKRKTKQLAKGLTLSQVRLVEFSETVRKQLRAIFVELLCRWHSDRAFPEGMEAILGDVKNVEHHAITKFADGSLGSLLPYCAITTELYVLYERNAHSSKLLTTNDWFDWCHAAVALPYCDVFLTESGLAHRLRHELKADKQYGCVVIGRLEDAIAQLQAAP